MFIGSWLVVLLSSLAVGDASYTSFVEECGIGIAKPLLKDIVSRPPDFASVNIEYVIASTLANTCDEQTPFVAFIEVRDSKHVTLSLESHISSIAAGGQVEVGNTWQPEEPGSYELRAFAITNFTNPQILTEVETNQIEIEP